MVLLPTTGFQLSTGEIFWLISMPSLVGATLRIPYTFMVPRFGGRNWTIVSAALLLIPSIGLAIAVSNPATPFGVLLLITALADFGGGNFASSMSNITFFYPAAQKEYALGLNAAGGNLGASVAQFVVPIASPSAPRPPSTSPSRASSGCRSSSWRWSVRTSARTTSAPPRPTSRHPSPL